MEERRREEQRKRAEEDRLRAELGVDCLTCKDSGKVPPGPNDSLWEQEHPRFCDCAVGKRLADEQYARDLVEREAEFRPTIDEAIKVPARFRGLTFDSFPDQTDPVLKQVREWVANHDGQRGLLLTGPFGRGKTVLMLSTLRELVVVKAKRRGFRVGPDAHGRFVTGPGLLESLRPVDRAERQWGANGAELREYQRVDVLGIDDIGAERLTAWGADRLFEVVNHRHNELLPMLLTSNLSPNELAQRWNTQVGDGESGDRIINRIIESCDVIAFGKDAPNWRTRRLS